MHVCNGSGRNGGNQQDCGALYLLYHWFHWQTAQTALACVLNAYARVAGAECLLHENLTNSPQQKTTEIVSARSRCNLSVLDFSCMKVYQA